MKLLGEEDIKSLSKVIKAQLEQDSSFTELEEEELKILRNNYLILKNYTADILASNIGISKEELLYSQYLWLAKYKNRYTSIVGYDSGLEQQIFNLAEEIDLQIEEGIDWTIVEGIENEILCEYEEK